MSERRRPNHFYEDLNESLRSLIRAGKFAAGEKFLTERQVSEMFATSRPTANKALSGLVSEGLLEFRKGVGTFVRPGVLDYDLRRLVSFTEKARAVGKRPRTDILAFEKSAARVPGPVREALRIPASGAVTYMERLRLADGLPVILERRYVVAAHCPGLKKSDLRGSLYQLWTDGFGLEITGAAETIRAVNLKRTEAVTFGLPARTASLQVIATGFLKGDIPLWWEDTLYRSDAYEFRNHLGGVVASHPAVGQFQPQSTTSKS